MNTQTGWSRWAAQTWIIARAEMGRAFFSKRAFWVYGLAFFPALIFFAHGIQMRIQKGKMESQQVAPAAVLESIKDGMSEAEVLKLLPEPVSDHQYKRRRGEERELEDGETAHVVRTVEMRHLEYWDGQRRYHVRLEDGKVASVSYRTSENLQDDVKVFSGVFQYFFLRLAIFFGCLGIFMNLFRGEMLDKTLHFWFLAPVKREVLLAGKYVAGLVAASVIFTGGAVLAFFLQLWPHAGADISAYWSGPGLEHLGWYVAAAVLGCVGYGSVFLASGLLLKNPIIPAAVMLVWESINGFLPTLLQKLSVLYYLQSMCPVAAPMDTDTPALLKLILSPAEPASKAGAVLGLCVVTGLVLLAASRAVRKIQINYSTD